MAWFFQLWNLVFQPFDLWLRLLYLNLDSFKSHLNVFSLAWLIVIFQPIFSLLFFSICLTKFSLRNYLVSEESFGHDSILKFLHECITNSLNETTFYQHLLVFVAIHENFVTIIFISYNIQSHLYPNPFQSEWFHFFHANKKENISSIKYIFMVWNAIKLCKLKRASWISPDQ